MAEQCGELRKRFVHDGYEYFLPVSAKVAEPYPETGTEKEKQEWFDRCLNEPFGETY